MTRLLYLNNALTDGIPERLDLEFRAKGLDTEVYWAGGNHFPESLEGYDAIFISGSPPPPWEKEPWILREAELIRDAAAREIPMLGVCFGSQILAYVLCGEETVFRRPDYEVGHVQIETTQAFAADPIACGVPPTFTLFSWHRDEVVAEHRGIVLLGSSKLCSNQVWRHRSARAWGIQGHPEAGGLFAEAWFEANREALSQSGMPESKWPQPLPQTPHAVQLFDNFARLAKG